MKLFDSFRHLMLSVGKSISGRRRQVRKGLEALDAYSRPYTTRIIDFGNMSPSDLADVLVESPILLKSLMLSSGIGGTRTLERETGLKINPFRCRSLSRAQALTIVEFIQPFLGSVTLDSLEDLDAYGWCDTQLRKFKGSWEVSFLGSLCAGFKKRKIEVDGERFEIDGSWPRKGLVNVAMDLKRIEGRADYHKRIDEINGKAREFRRYNPQGMFISVIYYPYSDRRDHLFGRLDMELVDYALIVDNQVDPKDIRERLHRVCHGGWHETANFCDKIGIGDVAVVRNPVDCPFDKTEDCRQFSAK